MNMKRIDARALLVILRMKRMVAIVMTVAISLGLVTTAPAGADDAIDACSLLTDAEVSSVVGAHHPGLGNSLLGSGCTWDTTDGGASLGLHLAKPGSADSGPASLEVVQSRPGSRPGPDGMVIREVPDTDIVHVVFAADGRTCVLGIVRSSVPDHVNAAVDLARKVQDRLQ